MVHKINAMNNIIPVLNKLYHSRNYQQIAIFRVNHVISFPKINYVF